MPNHDLQHALIQSQWKRGPSASNESVSLPAVLLIGDLVSTVKLRYGGCRSAPRWMMTPVIVNMVGALAVQAGPARA